MAWLYRDKAPLQKGIRVDTPDGIWEKCRNCNEVILRRSFEANLHVCPKCDHHFPIPPHERLSRMLDPNSFVEHDITLRSADPLNFSDSKTYAQRLIDTQRKLGKMDAFVAGEGTIRGRPIQMGSFDFAFMGGSMGVVVGEKILRLFKRCLKHEQPGVIFSTSGGARMQEGIMSLMQMAKTCSVLSELREAGLPFISVLCHPTTGGVAASFSMLGDINIGEPNALIGFAGPRVIQQTIRQELPPGFQRSEYLLEHGMLDRIVHRRDMRATVAELLDIIRPM